MSRRVERHLVLASELAARSDAELVEMLRNSPSTPGWGTNRIITIGNSKVFTKSVPLAARELSNVHSTANLFELPTFYSYPVGSAGFGTWREISLLLKTTEWVVEGAIGGFPLLHHHRILPLAKQARQFEASALERYCTYWDDDPHVRTFIESRMASTHAVVAFIEYLPHTLQQWLNQHQHRVKEVVEQMDEIISFLQCQDIVHFDTSLANVVTDGESIYLTDFGLALSGAFDLDPEERRFLDGHHNFDRGMFLECLTDPLEAMAGSFDEATRAEISRRYGDVSLPTLLNNLKDVLDHQGPTLDPTYVATLITYRPTILAMYDFFTRLLSGSKAAAGYDDAAIGRRLRHVGP